MYNVYILNGNEKTYIYRDVYIKDDTTLISPKLDLIESSAGTFSFKMPPSNRGYDILERLITEIVVERDDEEIWRGRALTIKEDFNKNRTITCEGELAYLNDTTQPQDIYEDTNLRSVLTTILNIHNQKSDKKFYVGIIFEELNVSITEFVTNYESTMKVLNEKVMGLIENVFLRLRKVNGVRYIDLIPDSSRDTSTQEIRFGKNMLDYTRSFDSTDFCTVVLPLGARIQDQYGISASGIEGVEAYTTAEDAPADNYHAAKSLYVVNPETVKTFGWIEKVINYSDEENPEFLVEYAEKYLTDNQFDKMVLELNAVDLGYLDVDVQKISLNEEVRAVSYPHGLDRYFPVKKISIPLDNPANTTFTLGTDVKISLSTKTNTATNNIMSYINSAPNASSILEAAKRNARDLISTNQTGYITITTDEKGTNELYITNQKIPENYNADNPPDGTNVTKYWRWNANGLEYVNRNESENPKIALTIDGAINADFITTGTLTADRIYGGTLTLGGLNNQSGKMILKDSSNKILSTIDNKGFTSYSENIYRTYHYSVIYGEPLTKYTFQRDDEQNRMIERSSYFSNLISYHRLNTSNLKLDTYPFAYIGIKGDTFRYGSSGDDGYQHLIIANEKRNLYLYTPESTIDLSAGSSIRLFAFNKNYDTEPTIYIETQHYYSDNTNYRIEFYMRSNKSGNKIELNLNDYYYGKYNNLKLEILRDGVHLWNGRYYGDFDGTFYGTLRDGITGKSSSKLLGPFYAKGGTGYVPGWYTFNFENGYFVGQSLEEEQESLFNNGITREIQYRDINNIARKCRFENGLLVYHDNMY